MADAGTGTLLVGAALAAVGGVDPRHRAVLVEGRQITWTGADPATAPLHGRVIDLGRAWLTPGFVDAHVHATATGLQAAGIDLTQADGPDAVLAAVRDHASRTTDPVIHGAGWDDLTWASRPTAQQLAAAAPGRTVVLVRVDGHSCLVDAGTLAALDLADAEEDVDRLPDGTPSGWLRESANEAAQTRMRAQLDPAQVAAARLATCDAALDLGITAMHEMGIPGLSDRGDALEWATNDWPLTVHAYWAAMEVDPTGTLLPGGDLFLDGSIGSCTAATSRPYRSGDGREVRGELFADDADVADFFVAATRAGVGAGVHAIGDRAVAQAIAAIDAAARTCGIDAVRAVRHRIEHVEVTSRDHLLAMARLGVTASVQPAFDAVWNGPGALYEQRFGRAAADDTNPFAWFAQEGVALCFSSDSTVTPLDPWGGVVAAERHHGGHGIDRAAALHAATIGGHRAVRADHRAGALTPGRRADLVAWPGDPLTAEHPEDWSPVAVMACGALVRGA